MPDSETQVLSGQVLNKPQVTVLKSL